MIAVPSAVSHPTETLLFLSPLSLPLQSLSWGDVEQEAESFYIHIWDSDRGPGIVPSLGFMSPNPTAIYH